MPRLDQRGRPYSATPRVPGSYSDSDSGGHSSEAVHTPPSSDEHPLPSNIGRRTIGQITEEIKLCTASLEAFTHDDPAHGQLAARLRFLRSEYVQTIVKDSNKFAQRRGLVGDFPPEYFDHNQPDYYGRCDSNIQRILGPRASVSSIRRPSISVAPGNIRSSARKLNQAAGGMYGRHSESRIPRGRNQETQSSSRADHVAPPMEDNIVPSAEHDRGQDPERFLGDMGGPVEDKTTNNKSNTAHTDCSYPHMEEQDSFVHRLDSLAVEEPEERGSPKLKSFDEIHRELRDQDVLPPYKYSPRQQDDHQAPLPTDVYWANVQQPEAPFWPEQLEPLKCLHGWKSCNTCAACTGRVVAVSSAANNATSSQWLEAYEGACSTQVTDFPGVKSGISIFRVSCPAQIYSSAKVLADPSPAMEFPATAKLPTYKRNQSTKTANEDQKPVATKTPRIQERPHVMCDNLSDSASEIVPVIAKLGHPAKASDVKTATGFASPHNPAAPDDPMVDEFLEVANDRFTRDEAFEILRMCGANLVAAVSMYRNAMGPEHLRQMLRAWLAPLENAEFETAARFYTENVDNQGKPWGAPSEEEVGIEEDEFRPIPSVMNVMDAFARLGLHDYNSVDFDHLQNAFENELTWCEGSARERQLIHQAYESIFRHQNNKDCWKLCPDPWTKEMDEKLMRCQNEDVQIKWDAIADTLGLIVQECKDRFNVLKSVKSNSNETKERESGEQQQKESVKATSVRSATPEPGVWGAPSPVYWDAAFGGDQSTNDPQPMPESTTMFTSTPKPEAPAPTAYTVTYWATIESGDESVHIPVDGINVSGPEKAVIEGSAGMKKVWKWIQEKGLGDKVDLQDAFDLAKDMHGEDEDEELVGEEPQLAQDTSYAFSRSSDGQWDIPAHISRSHDRSRASTRSVHTSMW
ncbi:hypothetical protein ACET3X_003496 [Alternaria dauci]|uniref:Myb-like domain-containing protein n=1 Tax=Alternaria dauci TaxID=48095 RepID=A0ABR3UUV4_9PLEO